MALAFHLLVFRRLLRGPAVTMIGSRWRIRLRWCVLQGIAGSFPRMFNLLSEPIWLGDASVTVTQIAAVSTTAVLLAGFTAAVVLHPRRPRHARAVGATRWPTPVADASARWRLPTARSWPWAALARHGRAHQPGHRPAAARVRRRHSGRPKAGAVAGAFLIALTLVTNLNFGWLYAKPVALICRGSAVFLICCWRLVSSPYGLFDCEVRVFDFLISSLTFGAIFALMTRA